MKNLTENTNGEISYKNDVILSLVSGRRENLQHKKQEHFDTYTRKFDEIILETQIQLRKRFGDFEAFPLKNVRYSITSYGQNHLTRTKNGDLIFWTK